MCGWSGCGGRQRGGSFCEFKGVANYWSVEVPGHSSVDAAWSYASPTRDFAGLKDCLAFYANRVDGVLCGWGASGGAGGGFLWGDGLLRG